MLSLDVPHLAIGLQRGTPPLRRPSMSALFPHTQVGCVLSTGAGEEGRAHADLVGGIALGYMGLLARGGSGDGEGEESGEEDAGGDDHLEVRARAGEVR